MKFRYYLENIAGVEIYPMLSLLLFVVFFIAVTFWAMKLSRTDVEKFEKLPLE